MKRAKQVLIVDDVDEMRILMSEVIATLEGIKVSGLAANTVEARLEVSRRRPDFILLDEVLPGESSIDFLKEVHAEKIPVILVTSLESATHALPPEAKGRIAKPHFRDLETFKNELSSFFQLA